MNKTQIFDSYEEFKNRVDKSINGVSREISEKYSYWEKMNESNQGCWDCVHCKNCTSCIQCVACDSCRFCNKANACFSCSYSICCVCCSFCFACYDCRTCFMCNECGFSDDLNGCNGVMAFQGVKDFKDGKIQIVTVGFDGSRIDPKLEKNLTAKAKKLSKRINNKIKECAIHNFINLALFDENFDRII